MKSIYVTELSPGDDVSEVFALRTVDLKEIQSGKMISLELVDRSGRIKGVIWNGTGAQMKILRPGSIIKIEGSVTTYRGANQITVAKIKQCEKYDPDDFIPRGDISYEDLESRLKKAIDEIKDNDYARLLSHIFSNPEMWKSFLMGVGGKLWHHNYLGGLAEHSLSMFDLCNDYCKRYAELDRDLILCGAILHDIGKIRSYSLAVAIDYTNEGRLLGHIVIGDEIVREAISEIAPFPEEKAMKIRHLILSHQGELEYASPVVPMMSESMALYTADLLDSKLAAMRRIRKNEDRPGVEWSKFVNLLDRQLYFGSKEEKNE